MDFPLLWGILTFFLSFVPYIGLAVTPAVVLALGEFGLSLAMLIIVGMAALPGSTLPADGGAFTPLRSDPW